MSDTNPNFSLYEPQNIAVLTPVPGAVPVTITATVPVGAPAKAPVEVPVAVPVAAVPVPKDLYPGFTP